MNSNRSQLPPSLRLAIVLFRYFPWGGLQANFLRIAQTCQARGHRVDVYTLDWEGARPPGLNVRIVPVSGRRNHVRYARFAEQVRRITDEVSYDLVIGFNRMPGLHLYYAADPCYVERVAMTRPWYYPLTARYRHFRDFESQLFGTDSEAVIMALAQRQIAEYRLRYGTHPERFRLLPPGVPADRRRGADWQSLRRKFRQRYKVDETESVVLMVGSGFERKGVDRSVRALAALPRTVRQNCRLMVVGKGRERSLYRLARKLGVAEQLTVVPGSDEIPLCLQGSDLLLHPARSENTGNVIVEAIAAGLPVLCSGTCGFASHVEQSRAGRVLSEPFKQVAMNEALVEMLSSVKMKAWSRNALAYAGQEDLYSRTECAVEIIESVSSRYKSRKNAQSAVFT